MKYVPKLDSLLAIIDRLNPAKNVRIGVLQQIISTLQIFLPNLAESKFF